MEQLSIDYRPRNLSQVIGQPTVVKALSNRTKTGKWSKVMLFEGPTGSGKSTVAQIVAMTINCTNPLTQGTKIQFQKDGPWVECQAGDPCGNCNSCRSIIEERFDGATQRLNGQATSKGEVIDFVSMASGATSLYGKNNIFIIEEADGLSEPAKKSMWKALEHPGKNTYFLLLSMTYDGLGKATDDRCQKLSFYPLGVKDLMLAVRDVMKKSGLWDKEGIPKTFYTEVIPIICEYAQGSVRGALSHVENCLFSELYTANDVRDSLRITSTEEVFTILKDALNVKREFFEKLDKLNLDEFYKKAYSILANGLIYRITQISKSDYFQAQNEFVSEHDNSIDLIKVFDEIHESAPYIRPQYFLSLMTQYYFAHKALRRIVD